VHVKVVADPRGQKVVADPRGQKVVADLRGQSSIAITGDAYGYTSVDAARTAIDSLAGRVGL
jgi:hypothetical protein